MVIITALCIAFLWGATTFFDKLGLFFGTPEQTLFAFYVWSVLMLLPFSVVMLWKKMGWAGFKIQAHTWKWVAVAVISDLIALLSIRFGLFSAPAGVVIALVSVYPVPVALISSKFLKERITRTQWIGIALACFGVILLSV